MYHMVKKHIFPIRLSQQEARNMQIFILYYEYPINIIVTADKHVEKCANGLFLVRLMVKVNQVYIRCFSFHR